MADHVHDYDWQSAYPSIVKPMCGRGSGKSQAQLQMYDAILKGEINMGAGADAWKTFLEKNRVKIGIDLAGNEIRDTTLKGENEMNIKETLNKIYGKPAATNEPIKDDIGTDKTFEELLMPKPEEEYIWVKGFKGTDKNMQCHGNYRYELGKQFDLNDDSEPLLCEKGFHFCKKLENVFRYYKIGDGNRFFEVEALVKKSDLEPRKEPNVRSGSDPWSIVYKSFMPHDDKYAAKSIRFIRELTVDEVFESVTDSDVREWAEEQKKRAMETSINTVRKDIRAFDLCAAGYSPAFAKYISVDAGRYATAMAMASLPDVSMDIKVMVIFMDNQDD